MADKSALILFSIDFFALAKASGDQTQEHKINVDAKDMDSWALLLLNTILDGTTIKMRQDAITSIFSKVEK